MTRAILTCSPHFIDLALNEVRRQHPDTTVLDRSPAGIVYLQTDRSFDQLTCFWRKRQPIYLHHLFPVHATLPLAATAEDLARLKQAAARISPADATVQVRSVTERELPYSPADIYHFITGKPLVYRRDKPSGRILSILIGEAEAGLHAYLGVSWATESLGVGRRSASGCRAGLEPRRIQAARSAQDFLDPPAPGRSGARSGGGSRRVDDAPAPARAAGDGGRADADVSLADARFRASAIRRCAPRIF